MSNYGLPTNLALGADVSPAVDNRLHGIVQTQLPGALSAIGAGVIETETGDSLMVVSENGAVTVSAGAAIVQSDEFAGRAPHAVWGVLLGPQTIASGDGWIHVRPVLDDAGAPNTEEGTAELEVFTSQDDEVPGALPLAQIENGAVIDRRTFIRADRALRQIAELLTALDALAARLDELEGGGEVDPDEGVSVGAFNALTLRVAALETAIAALTGGGNRTARAPLDDLVHEHAITRQIAGRDQPTELERSQSGNIIGIEGGGVFGDGTLDHPDFLLATNLTLNPDGTFEP